MRKTVAAIVVLAALCAAWSAWPLVALYDLSRAVRAADRAAIEKRIDFVSLRRSIGAQVAQAYARLTGARPEGGLIVATASSVLDPMVARLLSPDVIAAILKRGWSPAVLPEPPANLAAPNLDALGDIWRVYFASDYGIGEFRLALPLNTPLERQYRVHLALRNWQWKLAALDLPPELQERLAREILKEQPRRD